MSRRRESVEDAIEATIEATVKCLHCMLNNSYKTKLHLFPGYTPKVAAVRPEMTSMEVAKATMSCSREAVKGKTPSTSPITAHVSFTLERSSIGQHCGWRIAQE